MDQQFTTIELLNEGDVARMFRRSKQTIALWRKHERLPYVLIKGEGRDTIRYDRAKIAIWAKQHGKRLYLS